MNDLKPADSNNKEIVKYNYELPNLNKTFVIWLQSYNKDKLFYLFFSTIIILLIPLFIFLYPSTGEIAYTIFQLVAYIVFQFALCFNAYYWIRRMQKIDGSLLDNSISMIVTNSKKFKLLPDTSSFIYVEKDNVLKAHFEDIEKSLHGHIVYISPFVTITDDYIISKCASSFQYNPIVIPRSRIQKISFSKGVYRNGFIFRNYIMLDIKLTELDNPQRVKQLRRVLCKGFRLDNETTQLLSTYKIDSLNLDDLDELLS